MSKLYTVNTVNFRDHQGYARFIVGIVNDIDRDRKNIVWDRSIDPGTNFTSFSSGVDDNYMNYMFNSNDILCICEENVPAAVMPYFMDEYKRNAELDNNRLMIPKGFDTIEKYLKEVMTGEEPTEEELPEAVKVLDGTLYDYE